MWYAHGEDASWVATQLSGIANPLGANFNVGYAKLAIDQVNNNVHVIFYDIDNDFLYHARCEDPINPAVGVSWTTYGVNKYQRVCNCGNPKPSAAICIDGNVNNGDNDPHVVLEVTVGAGEIHQRLSVQRMKVGTCMYSG